MNPVWHVPEYNGKVYKTWSAAARDNGLQPNTLHKARYQGRMDKVGKNRGGADQKKEPVEINGVVYGSHKEACRRLKISGSTLTRWLDKGAHGSPTSDRGSPIELDGVQYSSISEASRILKVSRSTIQRRIERGDTDRRKSPKAKLCTSCMKRPRAGRFLCHHCLTMYSSDMRDFGR